MSPQNWNLLPQADGAISTLLSLSISPFANTTQLLTHSFLFNLSPNPNLKQSLIFVQCQSFVFEIFLDEEKKERKLIFAKEKKKFPPLPLPSPDNFAVPNDQIDVKKNGFSQFIGYCRQELPSKNVAFHYKPPMINSRVQKMRIAVEGCMHGDLDNVYATLLHLQEVQNIKIDLLLCCGDFQAVRNEKDLESLNVPPKYRSMNSFWKYYSGEKVAPFPTIFIGGNHEASNYLWELYYGGWAAPQIYFLGFAGVIKFGNIRIGGLSGIYKSHHYNLGHYEKLPYSQRDIRSIYHVREYDVHKLLQIEEPVDIFLSHDWPVGITNCGDLKALLRQKPFFEQEIQEGTLGSKPAAALLRKLRPSYWFSAHLHCKFAALVQHEKDGPSTKFLALDKCLPNRKFLQVIEIESGPGPHELQLDEEWLAITRKYNAVLPLTIRSANYNNVHLDIEQCRQLVRNKLQTRGSKLFEFVQTAPCYNPSQPVANGVFDGFYKNPQTEALLQFLELEYSLNKMSESREPAASPASFVSGCSFDYDSEDILIDDVDDTEDFKEVDPEDA